jgi:nucleoside-diphosphate-sugar epimerase
MQNALIGYTGFVGKSLGDQFKFDRLFNSSNIERLADQPYELIVCAGAPGIKWQANQQPDKDWVSIQRLMHSLESACADHVILISTVDVYNAPDNVDEDTPIDVDRNHAYGRHRWLLEQFVRDRFAATIIRLPGLFGVGLKKNVIFDLLHDNALDLVCPDSVYQFYDLIHLWSDIEIARHHRIPLINFATEGVSVREIARKVFGRDFTNAAPVHSVSYDFRSKYALIYSGNRHYLYNKAQVVAGLKDFVDGMKRRGE